MNKQAYTAGYLDIVEQHINRYPNNSAMLAIADTLVKRAVAAAANVQAIDKAFKNNASFIPAAAESRALTPNVGTVGKPTTSPVIPAVEAVVNPKQISKAIPDVSQSVEPAAVTSKPVGT